MIDHDHGGEIQLEVFICRACSQQSRVREVKYDSGGGCFVCEHCGAEHAFKQVPAPSGAGWKIEITGLRDKKKRAL
jgi:hypothetical protein